MRTIEVIHTDIRCFFDIIFFFSQLFLHIRHLSDNVMGAILFFVLSVKNGNGHVAAAVITAGTAV